MISLTKSRQQSTRLAETNSGRIYWVDLMRGLACLSMPIYHTIYNLYVVGLIDSRWSKHIFWECYQTIGLGTFVLVSGIAFSISTQNGVCWQRLIRRLIKLVIVAAAVSLGTYLVMPHAFVRFGVIHFFATTIVIAILIRPLKKWLIIPGIAIASLAFFLPRSGLWPDSYLYITGLMSHRPSSMDYIPLMPWLGVFMLGMGLGHGLPRPASNIELDSWKKPIIWLGKHSLPFYLIHQLVVYGVLVLIAKMLS